MIKLNQEDAFEYNRMLQKGYYSINNWNHRLSDHQWDLFNYWDELNKRRLFLQPDFTVEDEKRTE